MSEKTKDLSKRKPWFSKYLKKQWRKKKYRKKMSKVTSERNLDRWKEDGIYRKEMRILQAKNWKKMQKTLKNNPKMLAKLRRKQRKACRITGSLPATEKNKKAVSKAIRNFWRYDKEGVQRILQSHVFPSKPQIYIFKKLCRLGYLGVKLEYVVGKYSIDVALTKQKIAIEIDGKYWHRNCTSKDRAKTRFLRSEGWKVVRIDSRKVKQIPISKLLAKAK